MLGFHLMDVPQYYFLLSFELFTQLQGFTKDLEENCSRWQMLYDAKEPDNLPLHEPWYSRLSRFQKLLVIASLRTDKLVEMAYSYVSDHVGYKFVEPVTLDLGRVFSECESRYIYSMYLVTHNNIYKYGG